MKFRYRIQTALRAVPILLAACLAGGYTTWAQAIAIYDTNIDITVTIGDPTGDFLLQLDLSGTPIINPGNTASEAGAGGGFSVFDLGFNANAFAFGTAVPSGGPVFTDSSQIVTGTVSTFTFDPILGFIPNPNPVELIATITGSWETGASIGDPIESAFGNVFLSTSFVNAANPINETAIVPQGTILTDTGSNFAVNIPFTVLPGETVGIVFNVGASGNAFGVTETQPEPIGRFAVPEPGTLALFGVGLIAIAYIGRRRKARVPLSA